jgi:hypothetical protein
MDFFAVRFNMHQSVYTHKCVKAVEFMVRKHTAPHHSIQYQTTKNSCKNELLKPNQPTCIAPIFLFIFLSLLLAYDLFFSPFLPYSFSFSLSLSHSYFLSFSLSLPLSLLLSNLQLTDALVLANDHIFITGSITPKYPTGRYTHNITLF